MPPTHHISSTSRALYRVFIAPNLRTTANIPIQFAPAFAPSYGPPSATVNPLNQNQVRTKTFVKQDTRRHALADYFTVDDAITAPRINFVDENGEFFQNVPTREALDSFNRVTHHLVEVSPGRVDEYGVQDPDHPPVCRVVSKINLRAQHERKVATARRQARGVGIGPPPKNLELNWAIGGADLKHRLGKLKEFLVNGRKVEVLLGPKKGGKKATPEEANAVLKAVRDAVAECNGATELKSEGTVGAVLTLVFVGQKKAGKKGEAEEGEEQEEGGEEEEGGEKAEEGKKKKKNRRTKE
jgi:translation initiation factor IF-3